MKRHHDHSNSYKGKHLIGAGLQFRVLVHYCHGRKHSCTRADMMLEKEMRIFYLDPQKQEVNVTLDLAEEFETSKPVP